MIAQDPGAQGHRVTGVDGAVGPDLQSQLVVVGGVAYTGVLNGVIHLAHRGVDGVHRDQADDGLGGLVPVGRDIAAAVGQSQLHAQGGVGTQSGNVQLGVEDLHIGVTLDVAGSDLALAAGLNVNRLVLLAVELGDNALDVQDDLGHVLFDAGDGGKLMLDAGDLDGGHRGARQRGQQDPAQGVAQGGAVTALQGLHHILAVGSVTGIFHTINAGLLDFYHML